LQHKSTCRVREVVVVALGASSKHFEGHRRQVQLRHHNHNTYVRYTTYHSFY
jgi:hypothetical protein